MRQVRRRRTARHGVHGVVWTAAAAMVLVGCTGDATDPAPSPTETQTPTVEPSPTETEPDPEPEPAFPPGPDLPEATAEPQDVVTDLDAPWGMAFLPTGAVLLTLRDAGQVLLLSDAEPAALTGPGAEALVAGTATAGEGGLLGVAVSPDVEQDRLVYLYRTTPEGNEVVRAQLDTDDPAAPVLGELETVLGGIPAASTHNGGRIAFGPDGYLYVATGDAGDQPSSQDEGSLAGKILRITADGEPAPGNPVDGNPMWSLGHRNVQGLGWDADGRMFAAEFGQNAFDELNLIEPGGNYGWPEVEGRGEVEGFIDPLTTWEPPVASPSGLAVTDDGVYLAALRGERLWAVGFLDDGFADAGDALVGEYGRLRDVVHGPDGALWVLTNNTDGRGSPAQGDDRLMRLLPP